MLLIRGGRMGIGMNDENRERWSHGYFCLQAVLFVALSFVEYITLETFLNGDIISIGFSYGWRNVMILSGINLILVSVFRGVRPAFFLSGVFVILFGVVNYFVDSFRGYGIVYMDVYAVRTAADVAGDYSYRLDSSFWLGLLTGAVGLVLAGVAGGRGCAPKGKRDFLTSAGGIAFAVLFFVWMNFGGVFFDGVNGLTWDHNIGMAEYGYLLYAAANAGEAKIDPPEGYSVERVREILGRYHDDGTLARETPGYGASEDGSTLTRGKQPPNLIMIMNESFSDLESLGRFRTDRPYLSFFRSIQENAIRGTLHSSVYGGYTANSEFEFLTGCTKAFLPGNPYLQYIRDEIPTLIGNIKGQEGYRNAVAVHPYHASGYNRNRVYPLFSFDEFLSLEDFSDGTFVRDYISDESDYQMLEKLYEQKEEGTSLCLFNVTMQNHSGYKNTKYTFEEPVKITNISLQQEAEQYLSLMRLSDQALLGLLEYFEGVDEPVMIVLFGDHQPHLSDYFYKKVMGQMPDQLSAEDAMKRYEVPFLIWANYDIEEREIENTSINYLSALMMEAAGLELSDFQKFLLDMYQEIPSISANGYYDRDGKLHSIREKNGPAKKWLEEYEIVQYNYIFDRENRLDEYFCNGG